MQARPVTRTWDREQAPATHGLALVVNVLRRLEQSGVRYCYWKCSSGVGQALDGDKDLDLLIAHGDQHRAAAILGDDGLKLFPCVPGRDHPSVRSYLGFDEPSGRIVHLHVHFRLVVGEALFKAYRLPWEERLLARAQRHPVLPVRILDPAAEALVLLVRASLEFTRWDPVTVRRWSVAREQYRTDLAELGRLVPHDDFADLARDLLGQRHAAVVVEALKSADPLRQRGRVRRAVLDVVGGYRLCGPLEARARGLGRGVQWVLGGLNKRHGHLPRPWSRLAPGGGSVIAIVGLDGSGKSTAVATLRTWLADEVDVMPIYFGTGEGRPSWLLLPFKLLVPLVERVLRHKPSGSSHGAVTSERPRRLYSVLMTVWATVVAVEKRLKLVAARRAANRGMVVIADRYPQNEILPFNDGPLLPRLPKAPSRLRAFERATYAWAQMMPPDLVLKLVVTPATAERREPTMDRKVISERVVQLRDLTFGGARVVPIDAEQPLDQVCRAIKREVWAAL